MVISYVIYHTGRNVCCILPKIQTKRPKLRVFYQNDANGIANSEDPDQTAPLGAVLSGSALFANTYLSENLGSLRYAKSMFLMEHHNLIFASKNLSFKRAACLVQVLSQTLHVFH